MARVLTRDRRRHSNRGEGHVNTEAEIEVMPAQAKEGLEPPKAGRVKAGVSLRILV